MLFEDDVELNLTEELLDCPDLKVIDINSNTHEIVIGSKPELPLRFAQNTSTYKDGVWELIDIDLYNLCIDNVLADETIKIEVEATKVREKRAMLLSTTVDIMNPMWWESLTVEDKKIWSDYRQELLDISKQSGFPFDIIWAAVPKLLTILE